MSARPDEGETEKLPATFVQEAIGFYESLGAKAMNEWNVFRLNEKALTEVAKLHEPELG